MTETPGISLRSLFERSPDSALSEYVGAPIVRAIGHLSSRPLEHADLVALAEMAHSPLEALRNPGLRWQIINLLPLQKVEELAQRCDVVGHGSSLYGKLASELNNRAHEPKLLSFFGVVTSDIAPSFGSARQIAIQPAYGLFPHQLTVANRALDAIASEPRTAVIHMPTGSGKTRTAMHVVSGILNRNPDRMVIWLAQTAELLEQAADEFERAWGRLGAFETKVHRYWGDADLPLEDVRTGLLVAGFGKMNGLVKRDQNMIMKLGDRLKLLVVDEAHQALAPTYKQIISFMFAKSPDNALLGLTATPGRTWSNIEEDAELSAMFHNRKIMLQVEEYTNPVHFLIDNGYLAKPTFVALPVSGSVKLSAAEMVEVTEDNDIPASVLDRLSEDDQRNVQIIDCIRQLADRHARIIVFAATVKHARLMAAVLTFLGTRAFVVTGETEKIERERILFKFKSADPAPIVICNYGVLTTGFDAPRTSAAVIARPTKSLVLYSQMVGRAIRGVKAGGNESAEIVTIVDTTLPGFGDLAEAFANWEDVWESA